MSAFKLPDGPQTLPLIQTLEWMDHPLEYMEACAQRGKISLLCLS